VNRWCYYSKPMSFNFDFNVRAQNKGTLHYVGEWE